MSSPTPSLESPESRRPAGRVVVLLVALTGLAFLARLALVPLSDGIDWDGAGYMQQAERLGELLAGRFPSVLGERGAFVYPLGLPLLLRLTAPLAGGTRDAGVILSLLAGTALVPLAFALARELAGETAGLLAAGWTALDLPLVERSATVQSESVFAAFLAGGLLLLLRAPLVRRRAVVAAALLVGGASVRSVGLPIGLVAAVLLARRGERRVAAALVGGLVVVAAAQKAVEAHNGAVPYWRTVYRLTLWEEKVDPGFFDVDGTGATIRHGTDELGYGEVWRTRPRLALRVIGESALAGAGSLLPFALLVPFGVSRRGLLLVAAIGVGAVLPLALLQHPIYMPRMLLPFRPLVFALAAAAVRRGPRLRFSEGGATAVAVFLGLGVPLALGAPSFSGLARLGSKASPRARADGTAERIAAAVPPGERVLRGPGGDRTLLALASRCDVYAPATTPEKLRAFCEKNAIRFVLHDGSVPLEPLFRPFRTRTSLVGSGQQLTLLER